MVILILIKNINFGENGIRENNMIIRFSFKDIEDMIKNKLPMMGVDASFHWNPDNKDFNKESTTSYDIILEVNSSSF